MKNIRGLEIVRRAAVRVGMPCAVFLLRWWFQNGPLTALNTFLWDRFCRPYLNWRNYQLTVKTRAGDVFELSINEAVQRQIAYFGMWEPNLTDFLGSRLDRNLIFVDIGANVGYFSILASHRARHVIAFEPVPEIFDRLVKNVSLSRRTNITAHNLAISDVEEIVYIKPGPRGNIGATSIVRDVDSTSVQRLRAVRSVPLRKTLVAEVLQEIQIIKIDVEGSEYPILRDLLRLNQKLRPDLEIVAEIDPLSIQEYGSSLERLLDDYRGAGFHIYEIVNDYSPVPYLMREGPVPPRPLKSIPTIRTDLLFSRRLREA